MSTYEIITPAQWKELSSRKRIDNLSITTALEHLYKNSTFDERLDNLIDLYEACKQHQPINHYVTNIRQQAEKFIEIMGNSVVIGETIRMRKDRLDTVSNYLPNASAEGLSWQLNQPEDDQTTLSITSFANKEKGKARFEHSPPAESYSESSEMAKFHPNKNAFFGLTAVGKETTLHLASKKGEIEDMNNLINAAKDKNIYLMVVDSFNRTPLHSSARTGHVKAVNLLLNGISKDKKDAYLMAQDTHKNTALHLAAEKGYTKVINLLLSSISEYKKNDYILAKNHFNQTAIDIVQSFDEESRALLEGGLDKEAHAALHGTTPLHLSAGDGDVKAVQKLLSGISGDKKDALLTAQDSNGRTPLHLATQMGHGEMVKLLLHQIGFNKKEAYLKTEAHDSNSPLHSAVLSGHLEVVKVLLEAASDKEAYLRLRALGGTPLHLAAKCGETKIATFLLDAARDRDDYLMVVDSFNRTPLHRAAHTGHLDLAKFVLDNISQFKKDTYLMAPR